MLKGVEELVTIGMKSEDTECSSITDRMLCKMICINEPGFVNMYLWSEAEWVFNPQIALTALSLRR